MWKKEKKKRNMTKKKEISKTGKNKAKRRDYKMEKN